MRLTLRTLAVLIPLLLSSPLALLVGQASPCMPPVEMTGQFLRGSISVTQHQNDGMIGLNGTVTDIGLKVETVTPGLPAATAGILPGDVILAFDGKPVRGINTIEALTPIAAKGDGESVTVSLKRLGETKTVSVSVGTRKRLLANDPQWQAEAKLPAAIYQPIFGASAAVTATLCLTDQYPHDVFLGLYINSKDAPSFAVDDAKFFVLDGTGQQLRRVSLDEIKYGIQVEVANNWKGGSYPPPPPPSAQHQYTISGVESGNYTIGNLGGGMGTVSGTTNSTYSVSQQPDYSQLGYSLGLAIRKYRDSKSNQKLLEQANESIDSWERAYFKTQSPVVAGENRSGQIMYWTGSTRTPQPPYRVVLFLTDPIAHRQEHITFAFGPGAERIRQDVQAQSKVPPSRAEAESTLTNDNVLQMVKAGIGTEIIIAKIKTTSCRFETSPEVLKRLKDAGVPDPVVLAMIQSQKL